MKSKKLNLNDFMGVEKMQITERSFLLLDCLPLVISNHPTRTVAGCDMARYMMVN